MSILCETPMPPQFLQINSLYRGLWRNAQLWEGGRAVGSGWKEARPPADPEPRQPHLPRAWGQGPEVEAGQGWRCACRGRSGGAAEWKRAWGGPARGLHRPAAGGSDPAPSPRLGAPPHCPRGAGRKGGRGPSEPAARPASRGASPASAAAPSALTGPRLCLLQAFPPRRAEEAGTRREGPRLRGPGRRARRPVLGSRRGGSEAAPLTAAEAPGRVHSRARAAAGESAEPRPASRLRSGERVLAADTAHPLPTARPPPRAARWLPGSLLSGSFGILAANLGQSARISDLELPEEARSDPCWPCPSHRERLGSHLRGKRLGLAPDRAWAELP